mgnify:CR=1 FL=1
MTQREAIERLARIETTLLAIAEDMKSHRQRIEVAERKLVRFGAFGTAAMAVLAATGHLLVGGIGAVWTAIKGH